MNFDPIITVTLNTAIDRIVEVENLQVGGHVKGRRLARVPAGKGVNVSRTLAALGVTSTTTGFVGRAELAEYEGSFDPNCTRAQFLALEGSTRENITLIDPGAGTETHVRDVGITPTAADLERMRNKLNLLSRASGLVVISGSLPPGVDARYVVELVELAMANDARVAVDGSGTLLQALCDHPLWLIKPNAEELAEMSERESSSEKHLVSTGRRLSERAHFVLATRGAESGYLFVEGSAYRGRVKMAGGLVRSTVGCGDAMLGAFIAAVRRGDDERAAFRFALAVAAAAAMDDTPGRFDPASVDALAARASVEAVG